MPIVRTLAVLAAVLAAVAASGAAATPAAAATPCWKQLVDDWVKNARIDQAYAPSCYREALKHLPDDLEGYTAIREDIQRALQAAIRANSGREPEVVQPPKDQRDSDPLPGLIVGGGGGNDGDGGGGILDRLLPRANGTSSVPLPLLVLAGLALLLLAAAAVSFATRQLHARRVRPAPPVGKPPAR
jgi:hypothetical protein